MMAVYTHTLINSLRTVVIATLCWYTMIAISLLSRCFLNTETHFIWAFIAPVILIIAITFVLFVIVARVMWNHHKRRTDNSKVTNVKYVLH